MDLSFITLKIRGGIVPPTALNSFLVQKLTQDLLLFVEHGRDYPEKER